MSDSEINKNMMFSCHKCGEHYCAPYDTMFDTMCSECIGKAVRIPADITVDDDVTECFKIKYCKVNPLPVRLDKDGKVILRTFEELKGTAIESYVFDKKAAETDIGKEGTCKNPVSTLSAAVKLAEEANKKLGDFVFINTEPKSAHSVMQGEVIKDKECEHIMRTHYSYMGVPKYDKNNFCPKCGVVL